jgi:hypothetical protein
MPTGQANVALATGPSADPAVPLPATVLTTCAGVIMRTSLFEHSVTYRLPPLSSVTPSG